MSQSMNQPKPKDSDDPKWGRFASSGLELAAGIGLGAAVGAWIDKKRGASNPWGLLIGCCFGFVAGMYLLIKSAMKANKN
jgi:F0F1-type ATP synthase assembly protein I